MTPDDGVSVFESVRPRLFGIAYRMLRSLLASGLHRDVQIVPGAPTRSVRSTFST